MRPLHGHWRDWRIHRGTDGQKRTSTTPYNCAQKIQMFSPSYTWLSTNCLDSHLEMICLPGKAKSFSTPPVSFQCMSFFVGGAKSSVVMMSEVSANCSFISLESMPFFSSMMSFRLRRWRPRSLPFYLIFEEEEQGGENEIRNWMVTKKMCFSAFLWVRMCVNDSARVCLCVSIYIYICQYVYV